MPTFATAAVLFSTVFGASEIPTLRVVLDTDLGDDIDDTWALSALLQAMAGQVWQTQMPHRVSSNFHGLHRFIFTTVYMYRYSFHAYIPSQDVLASASRRLWTSVSSSRIRTAARAAPTPWRSFCAWLADLPRRSFR